MTTTNTHAALADLNFEPWDKGILHRLPSNEGWINPLLVTVRLAGATMCKTKDELQQMWSKD
ncbi:MAG: hypothetical protein ACREDO_04350 [Methyloceanibacter sp.]